MHSSVLGTNGQIKYNVTGAHTGRNCQHYFMGLIVIKRLTFPITWFGTTV